MAPEEKPAVREFLYDHYFSENPLYKFLGIHPRQDCQNIVTRLLDTVSDDASILAVEGLSNIVGCSLQTIVSNTDKTYQKFLPLEKATEKEAIMHSFQCYLEQQVFSNVNIFDKYKVDKFIKMRFGTVHKDFTSRGILKGIVNEAIDMSRRREIHCAVARSTHPASLEALRTLGFDAVAGAPYNNFIYNNQYLFAGNQGESWLMALKIT